MDIARSIIFSIQTSAYRDRSNELAHSTQHPRLNLVYLTTQNREFSPPVTDLPVMDTSYAMLTPLDKLCTNESE